MKTTIPFQGFYNSIHDQLIDENFDMIYQDDRGDTIDENLKEKSFDAIDWRNVHNEYSKTYTKKFSELIEIDSLKFRELVSPKFYNFETDRIFCDIELSDVLKIYHEIDLEKFRSEIKDRFTSQSGFISFYPNDLDLWPKDFSEWDCNHIGTLLETYAKQINDNQDFEYNLLEGLQESVFNILGSVIPSELYPVK